MNSSIRIKAGGPGEALIILENQAESYGKKLHVSFPSLSFIPVQEVINQETQGDALILTIDGDSLGDDVECGSPCKIKIPELELTGIVTWPMIEGRRSVRREIVRKKVESPTVSAAGVKNIPSAQDNVLLNREESLAEDMDMPSKETVKAPEPLSFEQERPVTDNARELLLEKTSFQKKKIPSFIWWLTVIIALLLLGEMVKPWTHRLFSSFHLSSSVVRSQGQKTGSLNKKKSNIEKPVVKSENHEKSLTSSLPKLQGLSVNEVIEKSPDIGSITQEGKRRLLNHQADDGILLLEDAASKGDKDGMYELGRLYDPVNFKSGGPIPSPDMREAARYYQDAVKHGSQQAVASRAALRDWLRGQEANGNEMARLTLKDFW